MRGADHEDGHLFAGHQVTGAVTAWHPGTAGGDTLIGKVSNETGRPVGGRHISKDGASYRSGSIAAAVFGAHNEDGHLFAGYQVSGAVATGYPGTTGGQPGRIISFDPVPGPVRGRNI